VVLEREPKARFGSVEVVRLEVRDALTVVSDGRRRERAAVGAGDTEEEREEQGAHAGPLVASRAHELRA
jgi:hypothetical protein